MVYVPGIASVGAGEPESLPLLPFVLPLPTTSGVDGVKGAIGEIETTIRVSCPLSASRSQSGTEA